MHFYGYFGFRRVGFGFSDRKVIFAVHFLNPKTADKHANTVRNRIYSHSGVVRGRY